MNLTSHRKKKKKTSHAQQLLHFFFLLFYPLIDACITTATRNRKIIEEQKGPSTCVHLTHGYPLYIYKYYIYVY